MSMISYKFIEVLKLSFKKTKVVNSSTVLAEMEGGRFIAAPTQEPRKKIKNRKKRKLMNFSLS